MKPLPYAGPALKAAGLQKDDLASAQAATDALTRPGVLNAYFATTWVEPGGVLEALFCQTVEGFCQAQPSQLRAYLDSDRDFSQITRDLIAYMFQTPPNLAGFETTIPELLGQGRAIQKTVEAALKDCRHPGKTLNILGYGADDCRFERTLAEFMLGPKGKPSLYRYDPFVSPEPGIIDLSKEELLAESPQTIDVVTSRWVLHHVTPDARWNEIQACIKRLRPHGHVVIVEEGDFAGRDNPQLTERLYRFLVMAMDVMANASLRPTWFTDTAPNFGADFDVDYLDGQDFHEIEQAFTADFRREMIAVSAGIRGGETLILYHIGH